MARLLHCPDEQAEPHTDESLAQGHAAKRGQGRDLQAALRPRPLSPAPPPRPRSAPAPRLLPCAPPRSPLTPPLWPPRAAPVPPISSLRLAPARRPGPRRAPRIPEAVGGTTALRGGGGPGGASPGEQAEGPSLAGATPAPRGVERPGSLRAWAAAGAAFPPWLLRCGFARPSGAGGRWPVAGGRASEPVPSSCLGDVSGERNRRRRAAAHVGLGRAPWRGPEPGGAAPRSRARACPAGPPPPGA